jgi:precorrin-6A/cobalt-precorrin-6A reductase
VKILLLGGTAEARSLIPALARHEVVMSLAGLTEAPDPGVAQVTGGFGGAEGLAEFLASGSFAALIDATHPFAIGMKRQAAEAAGRAGLPCLHLLRPAWRIDGARDVADAEAAAGLLPPGSRPFLALGSRHLDPFAARTDLSFLVRAVAAQPDRPPFRFVAGRAPFSLGQEIALFRRHRITHLVARNSGGSAGLAKFGAARALGLPVLLIRRPPPPEGLVFPDPAGLVAWLEGQR